MNDIATPSVEESWLVRLEALLHSVGLLGAFQAGFLLWRYQDMLGVPSTTQLLALMGLLLALPTVLVLLPPLLYVARRMGSGGASAWLRASGAASLGVIAWTLVDRMLSGPLDPGRLGPVIEALAVGLALFVGLRHPLLPTRPRQLLAVVTAILLALAPALLAPGLAFLALVPQAAEVAARPAGEAAPDVVLVSIDTLRADRLGYHGHLPSLSPELDRVAAEGVAFQQALASGSWTLPSMASLMTSLPSLKHGAGRRVEESAIWCTSLRDDLETLAERFSRAGYDTRAIVASPILVPEMGFDQGFQEFSNPLLQHMGAAVLLELPLGRLALEWIPASVFGDPRAQGVTDQALEWLAAAGNRPLFLWAHYFDPHAPYAEDPAKLAIVSNVDGDAQIAVWRELVMQLWVTPGDRDAMLELYDREIRYTDEQIGRLFAFLRERARSRPVVVAVTADHGEEFFEHGGVDHGHDFYREVTNVPLLFWGPGIVTPRAPVADPVSLVDVGPTLLELAGLRSPAAPDEDEGLSLIGVFDGAAQLSPRYSGGSNRHLPSVLVAEGRFRFILRANGVEELYDVESDPLERRNLAFERPGLAARYRALLAPRLPAFLEASEQRGQDALEPETMESLRALGYVN